MSNMTNYAENKFADAVRGQALGMPATWHVGLITCLKGLRLNSTAYALNDTLVVLIAAKYYLYKVTTAGTTAAAQPGTLTGTAGEAITDGTAVLTEQSAALEDGTLFAEVTGGNYSRATIAASLAAWAGTQGAGTTVASTGTTGATSNNAQLNFATPSANWHPNGGAIVGFVMFDAAVGGGNPWFYTLFAPRSVNSTDPAPYFPAAALGLTFS